MQSLALSTHKWPTLYFKPLNLGKSYVPYMAYDTQAVVLLHIQHSAASRAVWAN